MPQGMIIWGGNVFLVINVRENFLERESNIEDESAILEIAFVCGWALNTSMNGHRWKTSRFCRTGAAASRTVKTANETEIGTATAIGNAASKMTRARRTVPEVTTSGNRKPWNRNKMALLCLRKRDALLHQDTLDSIFLPLRKRISRLRDWARHGCRAPGARNGAVFFKQFKLQLHVSVSTAFNAWYNRDYVVIAARQHCSALYSVELHVNIVNTTWANFCGDRAF